MYYENFMKMFSLQIHYCIVKEIMQILQNKFEFIFQVHWNVLINKHQLFSFTVAMLNYAHYCLNHFPVNFRDTS